MKLAVKPHKNLTIELILNPLDFTPLHLKLSDPPRGAGRSLLRRSCSLLLPASESAGVVALPKNPGFRVWFGKNVAMNFLLAWNYLLCTP